MKIMSFLMIKSALYICLKLFYLGREKSSRCFCFQSLLQQLATRLVYFEIYHSIHSGNDQTHEKYQNYVPELLGHSHLFWNCLKWMLELHFFITRRFFFSQTLLIRPQPQFFNLFTSNLGSNLCSYQNQSPLNFIQGSWPIFSQAMIQQYSWLYSWGKREQNYLNQADCCPNFQDQGENAQASSQHSGTVDEMLYLRRYCENFYSLCQDDVIALPDIDYRVQGDRWAIAYTEQTLCRFYSCCWVGVRVGYRDYCQSSQQNILFNAIHNAK